MIFNLVKVPEQCGYGLLVRFLSRSEAGLVYAIVDVVVCPLIGFVNLFPECFGIQLNSLVFVLLGEEVVELVTRKHISQTRLSGRHTSV